MAREGTDVISVCCMKNDVGNVVSDADGMKNIWRNYIEKLINVENDWDGEVDCPEMMGPCCLISEEVVAAAIKGFKTLSKKAVFLMIGERVSWCLCTKGKMIHLGAVHTKLVGYWSSR